MTGRVEHSSVPFDDNGDDDGGAEDGHVFTFLNFGLK